MEPEKKSNGAFVGLIVIILVLILGGLYIWSTNRNSQPTQNETGSVPEDDTTTELYSLEASVQAADTNTGVDVNSVE